MPKKPRFDLFSLLECTAAIAFLAALLGGSGGVTSWSYQFTKLPPDDSALETWLDEHGHDNVKLSRDETSVKIVEKSSLFTRVSFDQSPTPPWQEMGYSPPTSTNISISWTMFSGSPYLWLIGFGILILLGVIRRRFITKKKDA